MIKYSLFFLPFVMIVSCTTQNGPDLAKQTVQDAFRFSSGKKYDSLSLILHSIWFKSSTENPEFAKDNLDIGFKDMRIVVKKSGLPKKSSLIGRQIESIGGDNYVITYYPRNTSELIDSIRFYFQIDYFGYGQIARYEVSKPLDRVQNIRTVGISKDTIPNK